MRFLACFTGFLAACGAIAGAATAFVGIWASDDMMGRWLATAFASFILAWMLGCVAAFLWDEY